MSEGYLRLLSDEAAREWEKRPDCDRSEILFRLDYQHKAAMLVMDLYYQVYNGGFQQWLDNGYWKHAADLLRVLCQIKTPAVQIVFDLVSAVIAASEPVISDPGDWEFANFDFESDDTRFYEVMGQFLADVGAWLFSQKEA